MSDDGEAVPLSKTHALIGKIVEGVTFVLFIGVITSQHAVILASAVVWTLIALGLPLTFRGVFTFAFLHPPTLNEQPRQLTTLSMMSIALGIIGVIAAFQLDILYALGDAAVLGCILFLAALLVDPRLRTRTQITLLAVQCVFWTLGARAMIAGLLNG